MSAERLSDTAFEKWWEDEMNKPPYTPKEIARSAWNARSELANVGAVVAWQWKLAGESEWMVTDTRPFLQTGMEIYALTRINAPTPAAPPNKGAEHIHEWKTKWVDGKHTGQECFCGTERNILTPLTAAATGERAGDDRRR